VSAVLRPRGSRGKNGMRDADLPTRFSTHRASSTVFIKEILHGVVIWLPVPMLQSPRSSGVVLLLWCEC
jgi:hypothetical protein